MNELYLGARLRQQTVDGRWLHRAYFDSAATSLPAEPVQQAHARFMDYYGSFHSDGHFSASMSMEAFEWSKARILAFLGADPEIYDVVFIGSGATSAINRLAAGLALLREERDTAIVSLMEHHSNDLPHRHHAPCVLHLPVDAASGWRIDPDRVEALLQANAGRVNYLAFTAASNVTGLINPVHEITAIAHRHGVPVLVDGAQIYAHHPFRVHDSRHDGVDFFVFSGHKAHAPGSPGVIVGRRAVLERMPPYFFGGGMVDEVSRYEFQVSSPVGKKEHAGTPNIAGAFAVGTATDFLAKEGLAHIAAEEQGLRRHFLEAAASEPRIRCYGATAAEDSLGILTFNLQGLPHAFVGAVLNDYHCMAVRTGCFCAHPYVKALLFEDFLAMDEEDEIEDYKGMVRASLGPHNTQAEIDRLLAALKQVLDQGPALMQEYERHGGAFRHRQARNMQHSFADFLAGALI